MRFTISRAAAALAGIILTLFAMTILSQRYVLNELKIGSAAYRSIIAGQNFIADLAPPPLFLVEAYLEIESSARGAIKSADAKARLGKLRQSYEERKGFWAKSAELPSSLRVLASGPEAADAERFWDEAQKTYLPALETDNRAAMASSLSRLSEIFAEHYDAVNRRVEAAQAFARSAESDASSLGDRLETTTLAIALVTLAVLVGIFVIVNRKLISPIAKLAAYTIRLAHEPVADSPPCGGRSDEIGQMNAAVEVFRQTMEDIRRAESEAAMARAKVAEQQKEHEAAARWYAEKRDFFFSECTAAMERLSTGDLQVRLDQEFIREFEKLRDAFNQAVERMQSTMQGVAARCGAIGASAREISRASDDLSQRNETQAATLAETASAVDNITNTVKAAAVSAAEARQIVGAAKGDAIKSESIVGDAIAAMGEIEKSSEQISQIIGVIDEIAFQTNLLALNAGVEAARAGEAGRGFAVVATEVRALAQRSADAAKEIKALISASSAKVQDGVALVAETGVSLERIVRDVSKIDAVVHEIAASAEAQSNSLREVNTAVQEIDHVTQKNAAMSEEMNAASRSLAGDSAELNALIVRFKIGAAPSAASFTNKARAKARQIPLAVSAGSAAPKLQAAVEEGWEEF